MDRPTREPHPGFPATAWSVIQGAQGDVDQDAQRAIASQSQGFVPAAGSQGKPCLVGNIARFTSQIGQVSGGTSNFTDAVEILLR